MVSYLQSPQNRIPKKKKKKQLFGTRPERLKLFTANVLIPNLSSPLEVGIVSLMYMKGYTALSRAWRSLGGFSSLWRRFLWWHSAGKAGNHQPLPGTESVTGVLLGSCNISAHSSAFPQRFLQLRKSPSKCPFLHALSIQQNLMGYAEVGFRTGKMKLDILKTSEQVTFHQEERSSSQFTFFNRSPPAGRNILTL